MATTFDSLVDRLATQFDVDKTTVITDVVNERQRRMVTEARWLVTQGTLATTVAGQAVYAVPATAVHVRFVQIGQQTYQWAGDEEVQQSGGGFWFSAAADATGLTRLRLFPAPATSGDSITGIVASMPADATYGAATPLVVPQDLTRELRAGCRATLLDEVSERPDLSAQAEALFADGVNKLRIRRQSIVGPGVTRARVQGYDFEETSQFASVMASIASVSGGGTGSTADLPWLTVEEYGAVGDDATDDTAAFNAAIAALPSAGGMILLGAKTYLLAGTVSLDNRTSLTLLGVGAARSGTKLHFTVTGSNTAIQARSTQSCRFERLTISHSDATWTGIALDISRHPTGSVDSSMNVVEACRFDLPQNAGSAATAVKNTKSFGGKIRDCYFTGGAVHIDGVAATSDYVNATQVTGSHFQYHNVVAIRGLGGAEAGNTISGCTFEPTLAGNAGAYLQPSGVPINALVYEGNWHGDVAGVTGNWVTVAGTGITVTGNLFSHGAKAVVSNGDSTLTVTANRFENTTNAVDPTVGAVKLVYFGNEDGTVTTPIVPVTFAAGSIVREGTALRTYGMAVTADRGGATHVRLANPGGSGPVIYFGSAEDTNLARHASRVLQATAGVQALVKAGAISDADYAATPPDGTWGVNTTASTIMVRIGGAWKSTAALT